MWLIKHLIKKRIFRQFTKFCIVGTVNTGLDFLIYVFLNRLIGLYFLYANICSILVAMTFSFILNKYWTFRDQSRDIKIQYFKFILVNGVYFLLYNSLFYCLVEIIGIYDLLAKVIAIFIGLFWNFFANRYFTFKAHKLEITN